MVSDKSATGKERELIIKLSRDGKSCREIASLLGISKSKAAYWIVRYAETKSLENKPRSGRPTKLNKEKMKEIQMALHKQSNIAGISPEQVRDILENEIGVKYTLRHTRRLMHSMGFSIIVTRNKRSRIRNKTQDEFHGSLRGKLWSLHP